MPPPWQCETEIVSKVIRIVESALACSSLPEGIQLKEREIQFANKFLNILISQNGSFADNEDDGILTTNGVVNTTSSSVPSLVGNSEGSTNSKHRLQHLELIKVGVLIVVISIIMLTTCRMVFQLFVRFRPEKPQD